MIVVSTIIQQVQYTGMYAGVVVLRNTCVFFGHEGPSLSLLCKEQQKQQACPPLPPGPTLTAAESKYYSVYIIISTITFTIIVVIIIWMYTEGMYQNAFDNPSALPIGPILIACFFPHRQD